MEMDSHELVNETSSILDDASSQDTNVSNNIFFRGDYTEIDNLSSDSSHRRKMYDDTVQVDKGYHKIFRQINGKKTKIAFYETNMTPGNMIRDAITGVRYSEYRVGSSSEDLFYTTCYSIGDTGKRDPCILYFDSPHEYENHFYTRISDKEIQRWTAKMIKEKERTED